MTLDEQIVASVLEAPTEETAPVTDEQVDESRRWDRWVAAFYRGQRWRDAQRRALSRILAQRVGSSSIA